MRILFLVKKEDYSKVSNLVLKDDLISRQSINFRDMASLGLKEDGYYLDLDGSEEAVKKAQEILKDLVKEVTGSDKDKVLEIITKQEESANAGFGSIFG